MVKNPRLFRFQIFPCFFSRLWVSGDNAVAIALAARHIAGEMRVSALLLSD
ncbi:MAG TPA: hypothetical protein VHE58_08450 [Burkholderiales bacterium]|nr:hypothetical protein [Burkholderiales bacterium]